MGILDSEWAVKISRQHMGSLRAEKIVRQLGSHLIGLSETEAEVIWNVKIVIRIRKINYCFHQISYSILTLVKEILQNPGDLIAIQDNRTKFPRKGVRPLVVGTFSSHYKICI